MGAFWCSSRVSDSGLNFLRKNAKCAYLLSATMSTANTAGVTAATYLARNTTLSSANFTLGDDSTNVGRKLTMSSMSTLPVDSSGNATCLVLCATAVGATGLFYYTKCSVNLASTNNSVSVQNWKITILDPTS